MSLLVDFGQTLWRFSIGSTLAEVTSVYQSAIEPGGERPDESGFNLLDKATRVLLEISR
jgi:hypothetical protein